MRLISYRVLRRVLVSVGVAAAALLATAAPTGLASEPIRIHIDRSIERQTIDGFGASDAWQCQYIGKNWPRETRERIADRLFSREVDGNGNPRGIGLSIWRFNVGAGTAEQGDDSGIRNPWRRAECFQDADGSYDWSKQAGQQWFLRAARERGVERLLAFANAPPVHLSRNGKGYAARGQKQLNLQPEKYGAYADFLAEVVEHFEHEGLTFAYLSPFNEPQWEWDQPKQEGTPGTNVELFELIRCLANELHSRRLTTQLVIGEAGTIGHIAQRMDDDGRDDQARFFFGKESPYNVGKLPNVAPIVSAHAYHSVWPLEQQVRYRRQLRAALDSVQPDLGFWQSEYCILEGPNDEVAGGRGRDLGMDTALYVARIIHHDLTIAEARSWQWWTAISQVDFKDGLLYLDDGSQGETGRMGPRAASLISDGKVRESKLLWTLGNFSRFIRPGSVRIECTTIPEQSYYDGVLPSAYKRADGSVVVVLLNLSEQEVECDLGGAKVIELYLTSHSTNLQRCVPPAAYVTLPPRSVVTCLCK